MKYKSRYVKDTENKKIQDLYIAITHKHSIDKTSRLKKRKLIDEFLP